MQFLNIYELRIGNCLLQVNHSIFVKICTRSSPNTQNTILLAKTVREYRILRHSLCTIPLKQKPTWSSHVNTDRQTIRCTTHVRSRTYLLTRLLPRYLKVPGWHLSAVSRIISTTETIPPLLMVLHPAQAFVSMAAASYRDTKELALSLNYEAWTDLFECKINPSVGADFLWQDKGCLAMTKSSAIRSHSGRSPNRIENSLEGSIG